MVSLPEIERRLDDVRQQGYDFCDQEIIPGIRALAAPVLNSKGYPVASLSVAAPSFAFSAEAFVGSTAPSVVDAARALSDKVNAAPAAASQP